MKKICALLLTIVLLATQCLALAENAGTVNTNNLKVGNPNPMQGYFFTDMWGNSTSDMDVRALLHGYNLVYWDGANGLFAVDPSVVSGAAVVDDEEGNRSFILVLADDLFYSDGSKITAWDYAFSYLLSMSPEIAEIGGTPRHSGFLKGYQEYMDGTAKALAGVHVMSDDTLTITVDHSYLPFFYEMGLLLCNPYPIKVIAPGVAVKDDGDGVYLANERANVQEPVFTAELLQKTILDPNTGYMSHPSVVSGPYRLTSWDGQTANFAINTYYKGNAYGDVPVIPTLTYTLAEYGTMIDQLEAGEFGLLNKVMRADEIMNGINRMNGSEFAMSNYPRAGLSYIGFACEKETVSSQAVRQAIAWCLDRDQTTADYTSNFGMRVDGYYGLGQWMYGILAGTTPPPVNPPENEFDTAGQAAYEKALEDYEALSLDGLTVYTADTEKAAALLDEDGWTLNEEGIREKDGVKLDLKLIYSEETNINEVFEKNLIPNLETVGIKLTMEPVGINDLLGFWYKKEEAREADMIFLATNFDIVFDPAVSFETGEDGKKAWANTNLQDETLYSEALAMRQTQPGDVLSYMQHWISFQERFNEVLPMIPIYSNIYFDFYTNALHDYPVSESMSWAEAIVGASLQ